MPDIKIDVSQILKDYFIPIVIAILIGLLSRALFFNTWLWPAIIVAGSFLTIELIVWVYCNLNKRVTKFRERVRYEKESQEQTVVDIQTAKSFFNSLSDSDKKLVFDLLDYPISDNSQPCERFVNPKSQLGWNMVNRISAFSRVISTNRLPCIGIVNYEESQYYDAYLHIVINPVFNSAIRQIRCNSNLKIK